MSMVRIEKGKDLIHKDDAQEKLEIILQGRVNMIVGDEVIPLDTGTIIGIAACEKQRYCCDYIAAEDTVLIHFLSAPRVLPPHPVQHDRQVGRKRRISGGLRHAGRTGARHLL